MIRRLAFSAVLLLLAMPACSGGVVVANQTSAAATGTGGGATTGGEGGNGSSGIGVTTGVGGTTGAGGVGGAPSCIQTHDALSVALSTWQGNTYDCAHGSSDFELSAAVVDTPGPGLFVLDSCSPGADCIPFISKLSIGAPGIATDVPKGAYVKVHVAIDLFMGGCTQRVQIKNLPTWDGMPNPAMAGDLLWFLGVEGGAGAFADTPFMATPVPLYCEVGEPSGCGVKDEDLWHFQLANQPGDPGVKVQMGATGYWGASVPSGFQFVSAHNLRSFSTGICDGPVELAYWIKHEYPLD